MGIIPAMDEDLNREEDSVTWMASARYFWSEDIMTFFTVATGEKSGGFTAAPGLAISSSQREYEAEETIHYELGIKSRWLSNRFQLNASLFYTEIEDFQNQTFEATSGAFIIDNAPQQISRGVDIEASAIITDWFTLDAAFELLDAEYDEFPNGPCFLAHPNFNPLGGNCDVSGEDLPWAPERSAVVAGNFVWPIGANQLYARIDYSYTGDHVAADDLDPLAVQSYELLNLRTGIRGQIGENSWDVSLWAKNVTDETYMLQSVGIPLFPGSFMQWLNPQRSWGATLSYEF
jgi:iron complex outermembrane receptor protein